MFDVNDTPKFFNLIFLFILIFEFLTSGEIFTN